MILVNEEEKNVSYRIDGDKWVRILKIARLVSWDPLGTSPPDNWTCKKPWSSMDYHNNIGQLVSARDALNISSAIEKLISLIMVSNPAADYDDYWVKVIWDSERHKRWEYAFSIGLKDEGNRFLFTEWWDRKLNNLVVFCRQGAFKIC